MAFKNSSGRKKIDLAPKPGSKTGKGAPCIVCRRLQCQLQSHKTYISRKQSAASQAVKTPSSDSSDDRSVLLNTAYVKSYAYTQAPPAPKSVISHSVGAGRLDGFRDLPIPNGHLTELHQAVYSLLNSKMGAATAFPLPEGFAVNDVGGAMIIPVMTNASVCLSVIAAWKAVESLTVQAPEVSYLKYERQALQSLRQGLVDRGNGAVTDEDISAAALLWATANMFGQPDALRRHAIGVHALVKARGGLRTLGHAGSIVQMILWADFLTAELIGDDVCFPDIGPMEPLTPSLLNLRKSLAPPESYRRHLLPDTIEAMQDMRLLLFCHSHAQRTGRISIPNYRALMSLLNQSTVTRIGLENRYKSKNVVDECVILAMNVLRLTVLFHAGPLTAVVHAVVKRLQSALLTSGNDLWLTCIDIHIWACFVGMSNPFGVAHPEWFTELIGGALTVKYSAGWPDDWKVDIRDMLQGIMWSDELLSDPLTEALNILETHILSPGNG